MAMLFLVQHAFHGTYIIHTIIHRLFPAGISPLNPSSAFIELLSKMNLSLSVKPA
jgi:hypothetical protein